MIIDHFNGTLLDQNNLPFSNYHALDDSIEGLFFISLNVRNQEIMKIEEAGPNVRQFMTLGTGTEIDHILPCFFNWFATTLVSHLRLVALIEIMNKNGWKSADLVVPSNMRTINQSCRQFVEDVVPEISLWRNKVSAHFAATDIRCGDNQATLEQSIMDNISYRTPYFYVGGFKWNTGGIESSLPSWAMTEVYERLQDRFWPQRKLQPLPELTDPT